MRINQQGFFRHFSPLGFFGHNATILKHLYQSSYNLSNCNIAILLLHWVCSTGPTSVCCKTVWKAGLWKL